MAEPNKIPAEAADADASKTETLSADKNLHEAAGPHDENKMPGALICAPVAYLIGLGVSAWAFHGVGWGLLWAGVPIAAIWFGALGGVVSSLQGMFFHRFRWLHRFDLWHVFSGILGAIYGIVSFLFLVVVVKAGTNGATLELSSPVFALGAFAIGYGQEHFHALMDKVFTALFSEPRNPDKPGADKTP